MTTLTITVETEIKTEDGKYCATDPRSCGYLRYAGCGEYRCDLFNRILNRCLGGGPLRCKECVEAERESKEDVK